MTGPAAVVRADIHPHLGHMKLLQLSIAWAFLCAAFPRSAVTQQLPGEGAMRATAAETGTRAPALWAGLHPGPHGVGYRTLDDDGVVVHVWYPTRHRGAQLTFRDYLPAGGDALTAFLLQAGVQPTVIDSLLASPLYAQPAAPPDERAFPLVMIAHGNGQDAADQAILAEYLASHGFVVASTPSPMLHTPLEHEDQVGALAEMQATELASAVGAVAAVLNVASARLGVVGHSFGARAALLLGMQDPRVAAIVSLDGGIGTATAVEPFRRAPSFRTDARVAPLLHFHEALDAFMTPDFTLLRGLNTSELKLVHASDMHHVHFTTYGFAAARFSDLARVTQATPATARSLAGVHEKTLAFLQRHLRPPGAS